MMQLPVVPINCYIEIRQKFLAWVWQRGSLTEASVHNPRSEIGTLPGPTMRCNYFMVPEI